MKFLGTVDGGKFKPFAPDHFKQWFKNKEGKDVEISLRVFKPTRSLQQNNYYWGVVIQMISDETGHTAEEVHETLKYKFLTEVLDNNFIKVKSTSELDTTEFENYLNNIKKFASVFLNLYIPEPNEEQK